MKSGVALAIIGSFLAVFILIGFVWMNLNKDNGIVILEGWGHGVAVCGEIITINPGTRKMALRKAGLKNTRLRTESGGSRGPSRAVSSA